MKMYTRFPLLLIICWFVGTDIFEYQYHHFNHEWKMTGVDDIWLIWSVTFTLIFIHIVIVDIIRKKKG